MNARRRKESWKRRYIGTRPWTRHSLVLMVAGFVYMAIGFAYFRMSEELPPDRLASLEVILQLMSLRNWGVVFFLVGLSAAISARWPPVAEKWGYMVLTGLSAGWATSYAIAVVIGDASYSYITTVLLWSLVAFLWWSISGLLNPPAVFRGTN